MKIKISSFGGFNDEFFSNVAYHLSNVFFFYGFLRSLKISGTIMGLAFILVQFFSIFFYYWHCLKGQEKKIARGK